MNKLSFGDYGVLDRLSVESMKFFGWESWTIRETGLAEVVEGRIYITRDGRKYLKDNKRPELPKGKSSKQPLSEVLEELIKRYGRKEFDAAVSKITSGL
jgi:hypothetical protein